MTREVGIEHKYPLKKIRLAAGQDIMSEHFNELWRYGASVEDEEEELKAEKMLQKIAEYIGQRL